MTQRKLVLQTALEQCMFAMDSIVGQASELESVGLVRDAEDLRSLAGEIENAFYRIRDRHKKRRN